eukprot:gene3257-5700_t
MKAIDVWAQHSPDFFERLPETERLGKQSKTDFSIAYKSPQELIKLMDEAGIDKVFLSAWNRPGKVVISNENVYSYTSKYPERFYGLASVDLEKPVEAVKELEKCVKEYGFIGLRIVPWLWNKPVTSNLYYPLFVKCIELDIPFCTQVGHTGPLCPSEVGRPIPYIDEIALTFPELKIICGHIGYPWTEEMIAVAWKHKNVFIDTSAYLPLYYPKQLIHYINSYGKNKVMFGTNFPQLSWKVCMDQIDQLKLSKSSKDHFLYKNAEKVFKLKNDQKLQSKL